MHAAMRSTAKRMTSNSAVRITIILLIGFCFGHAMSIIPSPTVAHVFWIGNLCAPWLALAFASGALQRRWAMAIVGGALADLACLVGFYGHFLLHSPTELGLPYGTPFVDYAGVALIHWLVFIRFWVVISVGAGAVYGLLGHWWRRSKATATVLALALPFVAEPGLWTLYGSQVPAVMWVAEIAAGIALVATLLRRRVTRSPRPTSAA